MNQVRLATRSAASLAVENIDNGVSQPIASVAVHVKATEAYARGEQTHRKSCFT